jgi:hypothetical protein
MKTAEHRRAHLGMPRGTRGRSINGDDLIYKLDRAADPAATGRAGWPR